MATARARPAGQRVSTEAAAAPSALSLLLGLEGLDFLDAVLHQCESSFLLTVATRVCLKWARAVDVVLRLRCARLGWEPFRSRRLQVSRYVQFQKQGIWRGQICVDHLSRPSSICAS
eukprot:502804-Pleurochrysis_carterae.AAC.1